MRAVVRCVVLLVPLLLGAVNAWSGVGRILIFEGDVRVNGEQVTAATELNQDELLLPAQTVRLRLCCQTTACWISRKTRKSKSTITASTPLTRRKITARSVFWRVRCVMSAAKSPRMTPRMSAFLPVLPLSGCVAPSSASRSVPTRVAISAIGGYLLSYCFILLAATSPNWSAEGSAKLKATIRVEAMVGEAVVVFEDIDCPEAKWLECPPGEVAQTNPVTCETVVALSTCMTRSMMWCGR